MQIKKKRDKNSLLSSLALNEQFIYHFANTQNKAKSSGVCSLSLSLPFKRKDHKSFSLHRTFQNKGVNNPDVLKVRSSRSKKLNKVIQKKQTVKPLSQYLSCERRSHPSPLSSAPTCRAMAGAACPHYFLPARLDYSQWLSAYG